MVLQAAVKQLVGLHGTASCSTHAARGLRHPLTEAGSSARPIWCATGSGHGDLGILGQEAIVAPLMHI